MPTLGQVMRSEIGEDRFRTSDAFALREERVTAMKLATGAPCAGHGAMFAPWPGPETDVRALVPARERPGGRSRRRRERCAPTAPARSRPRVMLNPFDRAAPTNAAGRHIVMLNPSDRSAPANAAGRHIVMLNPSDRSAPANAAGKHIPEPAS